MCLAIIFLTLSMTDDFLPIIIGFAMISSQKVGMLFGLIASLLEHYTVVMCELVNYISSQNN